MRMTRLIPAAAIAVAATGAFADQAQQRAPISPSPARERIPVSAMLPGTQALFDSYVNSGKMPGIAGAFGIGDRAPVFIDAGRVAEGDTASAAGPDSLWRVYSMTKPITAMAAMILIEEGKLGLDDPLAKYIAAFAHMRVLTNPDNSLASRPATRPITIRNLLTHTAGLGYNIIIKGPLLKEYERQGILPAAVNAQMEPMMRARRPGTLKAFAERVATLPLIAEPGTKWSYSIGLDVLGRVIEVASGQSLETFLQTRMFGPLGMTSTYWQVPASQVGRLATNYAFIGDNRVVLDPAKTSVFLQPPSFPYGGAGLVMSARDYDRFLHMLQNGGTLDGVTIMKPATVALAMSNLLPEGVTFGGIAGGTGGTNAAVPMGFGAGGSVYLADKPGGLSKGTYGWGGAAGTIAWVDPVRHIRATVMVNYFPADKWPTREQIPAALAKDAVRMER